MKNDPQVENLKYPFPYKQPVAWGDMDAFNHVNNVIYFRYFESARVEFLNKSNLWQLFIEENSRIVVVKLECNYVKEIIHPAEIEVSVALKKIGNSSITVHHIVRNKGEISAHGEGIIVSTNPATGKSTPWTPKIIAELNKWI